MRAGEGARADPWFDDPFAGVFVAAAGAGVAPDLAAMPPGAAEFLAVRTRFFDGQGRTACAGRIGQGVLLAGGLGCRGFRVDWPGGVRPFDGALPDAVAVKESV